MLLRRAQGALALAAAGALFLPTAAAEPLPSPSDPGASATAQPTSPGDPTPTGGTDPFVYTGPAAQPYASLSPEEVAAQVDEANALAERILANNQEISALVKELQKHSERANTLLQRYSTARQKHDEAEEEAKEARRAAEALKNRLAAGRKDLRDWAFGTFTEAGGYSDTLAFLNIMTKQPAQAGDSAGDLTYLTDERIHTVDLVREETEEQAALARRAEQAEERAAAEKAKADTARKELDAVIKDRKAKLETLRKDYTDELQAAGPLVQALFGVTGSDAEQAQSALMEAMEKAGQDVSSFEGGRPCSDNEASYPNGQLPPGALCPLIGGAGEALRPRAAAAFNTMSTAYARDTGQTICITDSYRSYAEQVIVKQQRGGWAAAPGTSNHGLGLALDLCGGINSFGTAAHAWMQQNAPLYGWFHPTWAQAGGSLPEPWHWEFAG
ncbi:M15 family metallopeptidase [Janibacter endophyticus]|uniref:M15 family metallopeptidase n=1 Tax=Janibacter endophyticus TaxID=2806261 RepID=UPI001F3C7BA4|nr:M15 family metallopeptidase [Janibacter endophyticus]